MQNIIAVPVASLMAPMTAVAFDLQGHRGARGLAPENTLEGFATALSIGVSTLELDLAMTKDGIVVVSHDRYLNPDHTRGPNGRFLAARGPAIRALTLAELQRYDVGRLQPGTVYAASFPEQRGIGGPAQRGGVAGSRGHSLDGERAHRHGASDRTRRRRHHHGLSRPPARGDGREGDAAAASRSGALNRRQSPSIVGVVGGLIMPSSVRKLSRRTGNEP
jgi:hypothetical protein